jgi:hypothetical protein
MASTHNCCLTRIYFQRLRKPLRVLYLGSWTHPTQRRRSSTAFYPEKPTVSADNISKTEYLKARHGAEMTKYQQITEAVPSGSHLVSASALLTAEEHEALTFLLPLSGDYPGFELWFRTKVIPGMRTGSRRLVRMERDGTLVGVGIAKLDEFEKKICTVRIAQSHFGRGFGIKLFDSLLQWLNTDQPHLTVSEKKLPAFERIFEYYGFHRTSGQLGRYVPNVMEFSYNDTASV